MYPNVTQLGSVCRLGVECAPVQSPPSRRLSLRRVLGL
jgi:hypothetical protein